jgi:thermostable 8-oxoguanine DNA glycosylase
MRKFDFTKQLPTHCSDKYEKEYFLIFAIFVAGKNAKVATEKTWELMKWIRQEETPFTYLKEVIKDDDLLSVYLKRIKVGQYARIEKALKDIVNLNVETCTLDDLLACHGVGPKTARFFLTHTRKDVELAILDVHILKWLKGIIGSSVPKSTPSGKKYLQLEKKCIDLLKLHFPKLSLAEADFEIWKRFAKA